MAEQALQEGAQDYLIKGQVEVRGILRALRYATERRRMDRLKDEFVSTVSHELRTPLTSIAGSLGLLVGGAAGNMLADGAGASSHCPNQQPKARAADQRYTRYREDRMRGCRLQVQAPRRAPLVEQAIEANRGYADGFRVRSGSTRPQPPARFTPTRTGWLQVLTNLLSNANKFSPPDGEVAVASTPQRTCASGCATTGEASLRVPATHLRASPRQTPPTRGKKAVPASGSASSSRSSRGSAAPSDSRMPRAAAPSSSSSCPAGIMSPALPIDREAKPDASRLLLCEDDLDTALTLRQQLAQVGFATDFAYTAGDGFARAEAVQYQAILMDIQLPDGDGISLIARLRALPQYRDTPIIIVSADTSRGREDLRSSKLNVLDWLNKPVDFERLVRLLSRRAVNYLKKTSAVPFTLMKIAPARAALAEIGDVVTVKSIDEARRALKDDDFDLAVLDVALAKDAGPYLFPELRPSRGNVIPVVVFSARGAKLAADPQHKAALGRSHTSIESPVATVRDRRHPDW